MFITRRTLLKSGLAVGALGAVGIGYTEISKIDTKAKIVIVGGGAGGIGISNMLLRKLNGAHITVIEPRDFHWYQPGQTLLLAGTYDTKSDVIAPLDRYTDSDIEWIKQTVVAFQPDANVVITDSGEKVAYDYLIVSTGLELRYDLIEGMDTALIGKDGITSIYFSPEAGLASYDQAQQFVQNPGNGQAVFTRPFGAMKCAGAPMKVTNLVEYFASQSERRNEIEFNYYTAENKLFAVKAFDSKLKEIWQRRQINPNYLQIMTGIDSSTKTAYFSQQDGSTNKVEWDFIHVVPPMSAPQVIRQSELADTQEFIGYIDVDNFTMQHKRYPNVFGLGDCVGTPIGKTAASVKSQLPVVAENLCSIISGKELTAKWDGYTSCPMIVDVGHAMLWEFNYDLQPVTALPFEVVDPLSESALAWRFEATLLRPVYDVMLKGYTPV
ncbi:pyridine nucleotide-disulfide oxidoreductase [Vibrio sp. HA2012]|uniref:FAD-dependent oxidoreductase n=1 Tax=Vibrio sp. HA2012 TaxID=1971595 RepID=UPI000C2B5FBC|nr:FAD-dependent oxidoreductase [Vibrio sp. HA2012]PJC87567.1 pyridine nucleotide-disulfide oxidoreductase [Vibrio sp. HA2012]